METETKRGLKEALGAIAAAIGVGVCIAVVYAMLSGCAGGKAYLHYEHHSSIPDFHDRGTSDMVGFCVNVNLGAGDYAPWMTGCVNKEVHDRGPDLLYGRDPSGELSVNVPIKSW